ncbi:MAG: hypothetical protein QOC82_1177 [Frankiaceae bacterium]|jgi:UPF0755 protein|nr:hypothetical protein [Frankiaceae bacterium]
MSDDLGIGLTAEDEPGPNYRARRVFAVVVVFVLVGALIVGVFGIVRGADGLRNLFGSPSDYSGSGTGSVVVEVHQGDTLSQIGQRLEQAGVVGSVGAFTAAADANDRSRLIGPGFYRLHKHMKASLALSLMLDPKSLVADRVTITEGMRMDAILLALSAKAHIPLQSLKNAAASPAALGVPAWGRGHSLEGFLFPATYNFAPGTTAVQALTAMVHRFNQAAASVDLVAQASARHLTPYAVLTLASIVQREGRLDSDFPTIAEVFHNRIARGMTLGSDATLYYIKPLGYGALTASDLKIDSPYNTRLHTGLPPTPIVSPGELALRAVLHPSVGDYLYFVTIDKQGHAAFAKTEAEFEKLVAESRRNGVS